MTDFGERPGDLRRAGEEFASSLRVVGDARWEGRLPDEGRPEDWAALIARVGPGTLGGVLRLLVPEGEDGFDSQDPKRLHDVPEALLDEDLPEAVLWGEFSSGETCWWLPLSEDPAEWFVVVCGDGAQQLDITTTEFLDAWLDGRLDLPVLSLPPVPLERTLVRAGAPVPAVDPPSAPRDSLAQLRTLIGSGTGPHDFDWDAIAEELGVPGLPTDYRRLHEEYGPVVAINGVFVAGPDGLVSAHDMFGDYLWDWSEHWDRPAGTDPDHAYAVHPEPGGLLYCGDTEGRDTLCWDTRDPDPDRWPVVGDGGVAASLTELLVRELTGSGLGLTDGGLGDPADWAWPYRGPRGARS